MTAATMTTEAMTTEAVVTGIGVTAPNGLGTQTWWDAVLQGRSGIRPITRFDASGYPVRLAGEITDFVDEEHIPSRLLPQTDRMTRLSLVAAQEALADAGVVPAELERYHAGVVTASSAGGFEFGQRELQALWSKGGPYVSAYQSFAWFYAVNSGQISIRHDFRGPSGVLVTEQAGGLDAVGQARRHVRKGVGLVVTGGVDASLCPWGWAAQISDGRLSTRTDPATAYRPFSADASGQVSGEGGALLVLESADEARRRGRRPYGTIAGCAATFDPPSGESRLGRAAELALADAGLSPQDVDLVFADASGVRAEDRAEAAALAGLFGVRGVPVTAPKATVGRLSSGAGGLDLAAALLALRHQIIPPTVNVGQPADDCPIDLVTDRPRAARLRVALVLARGRGGFNAATVVRTAS